MFEDNLIIKADARDYNGYFISEVRKIVKKILDITKIRDL